MRILEKLTRHGRKRNVEQENRDYVRPLLFRSSYRERGESFQISWSSAYANGLCAVQS